jgi:hypothetical protein
MITIANQLPDTRGWHLGILLGQIHRHLTHLHQTALSALAEDVLLRYLIVMAYLLKDIVDGKGMIVYLHGALDDTLCQPHVDG